MGGRKAEFGVRPPQSARHWRATDRNSRGTIQPHRIDPGPSTPKKIPGSRGPGCVPSIVYERSFTDQTDRQPAPTGCFFFFFTAEGIGLKPRKETTRTPTFRSKRWDPTVR